MCGIAGALFWDEADIGRDAGDLVSAMVDALGHRGPDGRGLVRCAGPVADRRTPTVVLGHTRLAILDLSERGRQPMKSASAPVWITFNGEIYNFKSLRRELEARGRVFRSDTDTEVILQGYEEWGARVVDRLRGMFAFAIWDGCAGELLLARDRLGIKPLYCYQDSRGVIFASEIRALLAAGLVSREIDRVAVSHFLAYQAVPPPRTLISQVRAQPPGHVVHWGSTPGATVTRRYWDLLGSAATDGAEATPQEARERVGALLRESAALHLISDVPVGVFLSGGIDSSALVALTAAAGATPRTFTVVLPGSSLDEAPFARSIARRFAAEHVEIVLDEVELRQRLPEALASVDHPTADGFNTYVVSKAVRAAGVTVALSGLGGDEMFCGYPSFRRLRTLSSYAPLWRRSPRPARAAAAAAVRALGRESVASRKAAAVLESDGALARTFPLTRQVFAADERQALLQPEAFEAARREGDPYVRLLEAAIAAHPAAGLMSLVSFAEARTYMHDVLLRDTDQMSMAHGLEARVPLLDHCLVEYVMGLPDAVKAPGETPKQLLVESLPAPLPDACVHRPKQGFVLPFDRWMRGELRSFCEHRLGRMGLAGRGLFREAGLSALWQSFLADDGRTSWSRPWALVALDSWIEQNGINV
jgi:asparagine synthase (glutamine-hydrolysing)